MNYEAQLVAEAESWLIEDEERRHEKLQREIIRHPKLVRDLLLDRLATEAMDVLEVGGGPEPVSDQIPFKARVVVDPLTAQYRRFYPCPDHVALKGEDMDYEWAFDLAICTNALDHVEDPQEVAFNIGCALKSGGYAAIMCAENNAITNPHPAHVHNLTAHTIHEWFDADFETCWELTYERDGYRYGWAPYRGRRGQPAFALLLRKCSGYS